MRRILGHVEIDSSMLSSLPDGKEIIPGTVEPNSANLGKTGLITSGDNILSRQNITATIAKSGGLTSGIGVSRYYDRYGSFVYKLGDVEDTSGTSRVDDTLPMGKDPVQQPLSHQVLETTMDESGTPELFDVCCCKLERHEDDGKIGLCAYIGHRSGNTIVSTTGFYLEAAQGTSVTENEGYSWQVETGFGNDIDSQTSPSYDPSHDIVEMDDGSVIYALCWGDTIEIYLSFDGGDSFTNTASISISSAASYKMAIERIGSMAVIMFGRVNGGDVEIHSVRSTDGGMTWYGSDPSSSNPEKVYDETPVATPSNFDLELIRNVVLDRLELIFTYEGGNVYIHHTRNGIDFFDASATSITSVDTNAIAAVDYYKSAIQLFGVIDNANGDFIRAYEAVILESTSFISTGEFLLGVRKSTLSPIALACDSFNNDGFIEVISMHYNSAGSDDWMVVASRCAMWSSVAAFDPDVRTEDWTINYVPFAYPSAADADPNFANWTRILTATGSSTLNGPLYGELQLTAAAVSDTIGYERTNAAHGDPPSDSYNDGMVTNFEMKVGSGDSYFQVYANLSQAGSGVESQIVITFTQTGVEVYDQIAAHLAHTVTPTNWDPTEWNMYRLVFHGTYVVLYRAPSDVMREAMSFEKVFGATLTSGPWSANGVELEWGILARAGKTAAGDAYVRSFCYMKSESFDDSDMDNADFEGYGMGCRNWPVGLVQGLSCKFTGTHAYQTDEWTVETDEVYSAKNIFTPSPSIMWKEPAQSVGSDSPERVIDVIVGDDTNGEPLSTQMNGFALFGRNFMNFKVETMNDDGTGATTRFDTSGSDKSYLCEWEINDVTDNVIKVWPSSPAGGQSSFTPMIPGQFAPTGTRKYYIKMKDGANANDVYLITGNAEHRLFFDIDLEADGVADDDNFYLFSSSFFFYIDTDTFDERFKLTIYTQARAPEETSLQLGTLVIGQLFELPDDEWGAQYNIASNNAVKVGRSGRKVVAELGPPRRSVTLSYTGMTDKGMGITSPNELFRVVSGKHMLVWIDDDSPQENDSNFGHSEPMLCRHSGNISQRQVAYNYYDESDSEGFGYGQSIHNVIDTSGIVLDEEV